METSLNKCSRCGTKDGVRFILKLNEWLCENCLSAERGDGEYKSEEEIIHEENEEAIKRFDELVLQRAAGIID